LNNKVEDLFFDEALDHGLLYPKVAYYKKEETEESKTPAVEKLFVFGGHNSVGDNFYYDFKATNPVDRVKVMTESHLALNIADDNELVFNAAVQV
jgi:hypothetical protein